MSDEIAEQAKKTVLLRIVEWTAFIPQEKDPNSQLMINNGVTGFEAFEHEKLIDTDCYPTGQAKHIPVEIDGEMVNVRHGLYAMRAVLASNFDGPLPDGPKPDAAHHVVMPGQANRAERRSKAK